MIRAAPCSSAAAGESLRTFWNLDGDGFAHQTIRRGRCLCEDLKIWPKQFKPIRFNYQVTLSTELYGGPIFSQLQVKW